MLADECVVLLQMGKVPKKKNLADKVRKTKTSTAIKNNPFEVKINRKKFDILGRKTKHDVGLPGVSRSKAINKVKRRLLLNINVYFVFPCVQFTNINAFCSIVDHFCSHQSVNCQIILTHATSLLSQISVIKPDHLYKNPKEIQFTVI